MKKFSLALLALAAALAISSTASATSISGTLNVIGTAVATPTSLNIDNPATIANNSTLNFAPDHGQNISFTNPVSSPVVGGTLFTAAGDTAPFLFVWEGGSATYNPTDQNWTILGYGWMEESGYDNTAYQIDLTSNDLGAVTFSMTAQAPEPGSLLLLGTGLLGLAFVAFRKAKSSGMVLSM